MAYFYSVEDDGTIAGIYESELEESIETLESMCALISGASIGGVDRRRVSRRPDLYAAQVCIRFLSYTSNEESLRRLVKIAFVGETNVGKSTLISVLCSAGDLDNGNGSCRVALLRHRHEVLSGRTSSLAVEFLPFNVQTKQPIKIELDSTEPVPLSIQKSLLSTRRVAQLLDLAGDHRYQKITFSALTSWSCPDWICLVVDATSITKTSLVTAETRNYLTLILGLEIPFFIVINKVDLVSDEASSISSLLTELPELITRLRKEIFGPKISPISVSLFKSSCVNGAGMPVLIQHLYRIHPRRNVSLMNYLLEWMPCSLSMFCVEAVCRIPDTGTILFGTVTFGHVDLDSSFKGLIGPLQDGTFVQITIKSIHRMRLPVRQAMAGQMVTFAVECLLPDEHMHKSMILITLPLDVAMPEQSVKLLDTIQVDLVGCSHEQANAITEPIQGLLYWMGCRWAASLVSIHVFYLEFKMRAVFKLIDKAWPLPGSRLVFVAGNNLRLQGVVGSSSITASLPH